MARGAFLSGEAPQPAPAPGFNRSLVEAATPPGPLGLEEAIALWG
jgi:hypothetical protein